MAFCAWCGSQVSAASYAACPRCGNPSNGAARVAPPPGPNKTAMVVIGILIGIPIFIAILGILAAIAVPNFVTAAHRSRQKRSMADMRTIATALESYAAEEDRYPELPMTELATVLVPKYLDAMPTHDGWGTEFRYECWPSSVCSSYAIASAGKDRKFERGSLSEYARDVKTSNFDEDIVFANGSFSQYPEGVQH